jgi:alpha-galactosidase
MPPKYRFVGLHSTQIYTLTLVWPTALKEYSRSIISVIDGRAFSGEILMDMGMQLPITFPQTSLIFELKSV